MRTFQHSAACPAILLSPSSPVQDFAAIISQLNDQFFAFFAVRSAKPSHPAASRIAFEAPFRPAG